MVGCTQTCAPIAPSLSEFKFGIFATLAAPGGAMDRRRVTFADDTPPAPEEERAADSQGQQHAQTDDIPDDEGAADSEAVPPSLWMHLMEQETGDPWKAAMKLADARAAASQAGVSLWQWWEEQNELLLQQYRRRQQQQQQQQPHCPMPSRAVPIPGDQVTPPPLIPPKRP